VDLQAQTGRNIALESRNLEMKYDLVHLLSLLALILYRFYHIFTLFFLCFLPLYCLILLVPLLLFFSSFHSVSSLFLISYSSDFASSFSSPSFSLRPSLVRNYARNTHIANPETGPYIHAV
jgi:hypothetical protein